MNDLYLRAVNQITSAQSAAAVAQYQGILVPANECWLVQEVVAFHDDNLGATLSWRLEGEAGDQIVLPIGATWDNIRVKLSTYYACPFWLAPVMSVTIVASAALAAGKKFTMGYHVHKVRGIPAGSYYL